MITNTLMQYTGMIASSIVKMRKNSSIELDAISGIMAGVTVGATTMGSGFFVAQAISSTSTLSKTLNLSGSISLLVSGIATIKLAFLCSDRMEIADKNLLKKPILSTIDGIFLGINPEIVSILNVWADETLDHNRQWFYAREKIIEFYANSTTTLDLSSNQLDSIPNIFSFLDFQKNITKLDLSKNQLTTLPKSIGNLQALEYLDLSYNRTLSQLPQSILTLPNTCLVDITGCNLSEDFRKEIEEVTDGPLITWNKTPIVQRRIVIEQPVALANTNHVDRLNLPSYSISI